MVCIPSYNAKYYRFVLQLMGHIGKTGIGPKAEKRDFSYSNPHKIRVDLVVRVTLVQRLGLSATDIVMQASRVRTVGADTTRHSGPLAPLPRRLLQFSIKKSDFGLISQPHAWLRDGCSACGPDGLAGTPCTYLGGQSACSSMSQYAALPRDELLERRGSRTWSSSKYAERLRPRRWRHSSCSWFRRSMIDIHHLIPPNPLPNTHSLLVWCWARTPCRPPRTMMGRPTSG